MTELLIKTKYLKCVRNVSEIRQDLGVGKVSGRCRGGVGEVSGKYHKSEF